MATSPIDGALVPPALPARRWLAPRSDGARLHAGVDLGGPGDIVRAPASGIVALVGRASRPRDERRWSQPQGWSGYGPAFIFMQADDGTWHLLGHVASATVRPGQRVAEGEPLALVSDLGHVHWEVRERPHPPPGAATVEIALDPAAWLRGERVLYRPDQHGCPPAPADDRRTPRACRPSHAEAPAPAREHAAPARPTTPRGGAREAGHGS